jgi:toxin ParE1/3/4
MLDEAVAYVAKDSRPSGERLLIEALEAASSLDVQGERGRILPEFARPTVRELFVQRYRPLYQVAPAEIEILAFIHGARDLTRWRREG